MVQIEEASASHRSILTYHRELLVSRLRSVQCIVDNLSARDFFCQEEVEIVQQTVTKTDQVCVCVRAGRGFGSSKLKNKTGSSVLIHCFFLCFRVITFQVRKILELVQCKGEEACEYFIYIIYKVGDAYIDLQPWLEEIGYVPSDEVKGFNVVNTDPSK